MSTTKRICGTYTIQSVCAGSEVLFETEKVTIDGDLVVIGSSTSVESTNTEISDNLITLNNGETGAGISEPFGSGIAIDRGTSPLVYLRYNEALPGWEATDDGTVWYPLNQLGSFTFEVVNDLTPQLGGDLDVNGFEITSAANGDVVLDADGTGEVKLNHELSLEEQATDPTVTAGYNKLYAKDPGPGGTGLYVKNDTTEDELVSNEQAIVYSLIF